MAEEKTPEQVAQEKKREIALKNLKSKVVDIGTSYLVHSSKLYGEAGDSAMESYKYLPIFNEGLKAYDKEGNEYGVIQNAILGSREEGARYGGNISEMKIMKDCAAIINESISDLKVSDIVELMGSEMNIKDKFKNKYLNSLAPKMRKEDAEKLTDEQKKAMKASTNLYQNLVGTYQNYLMNTKVSEALSEEAKEIPKGLESLLAEEKPKK